MSGVERVRAFYDAFARRDGAAMSAFYTERATFRDPVFDGLVGGEIGAMWRMLCARGKDLEVTASRIEGDDRRVVAHWEATYTFSATNRRVHNVVDATFELDEGRFVSHVDAFDFWRWSRQALGAPGLLLGWTPIVRGKVQRQARKGLDAFRAHELKTAS